MQEKQKISSNLQPYLSYLPFNEEEDTITTNFELHIYDEDQRRRRRRQQL